MSKSIIGFHYSVTGDKRGTREYMDTLNKNGIPFMVKGTDDTGLIIQSLEYSEKYKETGVKNWLIYRMTSAGQQGHTEYDVPDYQKSPKAAAREHFDKTKAKWPIDLQPDHIRKQVWMEPINEPRGKVGYKENGDPEDQYNGMHPVDWLGEFMYEYAQIANHPDHGFKVCGPSFNSGEPGDTDQGIQDAVTQYSQPGMLKYLKYCADNPEKAALAVHEYSWNGWENGESFDHWYPQKFGRIEAAIAAADLNSIPRTFPIFVTEWGFNGGNAPQWDQAKAHLIAYNRWAARFPQVKGVAAWALQVYYGGSGDSRPDRDLVTWIDPSRSDNLQNHAVYHEYTSPDSPAQTHPIFGGTLPVNEIGNLESARTNSERLIPAQTRDPFKFEVWPTEFKHITQNFGDRKTYYQRFGLPGHEGIDIRASNGSKVFAVADGIVTAVGDDRVDAEHGGHNYGTRITIEHDYGYETTYAHLDRRVVHLGDRVNAGAIIGFADSTGNVDGPHLHLTLKHKDAYFDQVTGSSGRYYSHYPYKIIDPTRFIDPLLHNDKPLGIDLSYANGSGHDFKLLADVGVKFAFVRVSNGTYLKDPNRPLKDPKYDEFVSGLRTNNIFFGNYYYLDDEVDPVRQCHHFIEQGDWNCQLPAVLDVEAAYNEHMTETTVRTWVETFRHEMPDMPLMIYTRHGYWNRLVSRSSTWANDLYLWIAHWTPKQEPLIPHNWHTWHFWQFSENSRWPGYRAGGGLDINRFNGSLEELTRLANRIQNRDIHYVSPPQPTIPQVGYVNSLVGLNMRSGPGLAGLGASIIELLAHGTEIEILSKQADNDRNSIRQWYKVRVQGERGYVASDYVSLESTELIALDMSPTAESASMTLETGMNINPSAPHSQPSDPATFKGLDWVRLVFKLDDRLGPDRGNLSSAFAYFDPIVRSYTDQGVKILFILNQETRQPRLTHNNWREPEHWSSYCDYMAETAGIIAKHYQPFGAQIAYQIWNEGDKQYDPENPGIENIPSLHLRPKEMARLMQKVCDAIRVNGPASQIVFNGMAEGAEIAIAYLKECKNALNGPWPVDALAIHPYTHITSIEGAPFDWNVGRPLLKDTLKKYQDAFPNMPIWITEIGVAGDNRESLSGDHIYREVAKYMRDFYLRVGRDHIAQVPVLIWFAWSDNMHNAGMVKGDGSEKAYLFQTFKDIRDKLIM